MSIAKNRANLRVAIVGFGSIGRRHFENLRSLGVQDVVLVRRPTGANPAFTPPPDAPVVYSPRAALEHGIDVALVCNPTSLHARSAEILLTAEVPVLIEKPVAHSLDTAIGLAKLAANRGVAAGVAYCMRYHPAYAAARWAVESGRIGRVLYAKAWFESYLPDWHPWEDYRQSYAARRELGGGAALTLDHEIDFLNWCLGAPLSAQCRTLRSGALEADVDDVAHVSLRYPKGIPAEVHQSMCRCDYSRGFDLVGKSGTLTYRFDTGRLVLSTNGESRADTLWDGAGYDLNEMYRELLAGFLDAVLAGSDAPIPLAAGIDTLRAIATSLPAGSFAQGAT